jgi:valyl-tRNA synthetase
MPLSDLVDAEKEKARINGEIEKAKKFVASLGAKLSNESFVQKAPAAIVEAEKQKLEKNKALIAKLEDSLRLL